MKNKNDPITKYNQKILLSGTSPRHSLLIIMGQPPLTLNLSPLWLIPIPDDFTYYTQQTFFWIVQGKGTFPAVSNCRTDIYAAAAEPVYVLNGNVFVVTLTKHFRISSNDITKLFAC